MTDNDKPVIAGLIELGFEEAQNNSKFAIYFLRRKSVRHSFRIGKRATNRRYSMRTDSGSPHTPTMHYRPIYFTDYCPPYIILAAVKAAIESEDLTKGERPSYHNTK